MSRADSIPDLGHGGKSIREFLILAAASVPGGMAIIDIAPYLGSTTAYLALGVKLSRRSVMIHSIDRWLADSEYCRKAFTHHGMEFIAGESLQPRWEANVGPFSDGNIVGHQSDIETFRYKGLKIGLYVDDICNNKRKHDAAMRTFAPYFVPNRTVLCLMDFYFYERKPQVCFQYQRDFMALNSENFLPLGRIRRSLASLFLYLGGRSFQYPPGSYQTQ